MDELPTSSRWTRGTPAQKHAPQGETSEVFRIMGEGTEGVAMIIESCKLEECIARGKELIGWDPGHLVREIAPGKLRAKGMAIAMQGSGIPLVDMGSARIELQDGGFFKLHVGATDLGTGSDTILAQIAAEELGVDMKDIVITPRTPTTQTLRRGRLRLEHHVCVRSAYSSGPQSQGEAHRAVADRFGVAPEDIISRT